MGNSIQHRRQEVSLTGRSSDRMLPNDFCAQLKRTRHGTTVPYRDGPDFLLLPQED